MKCLLGPYQKGDRVRIKDTSVVGVVTRVQRKLDDTEFCIDVAYTGRLGCYSAEQLEPAPPEPISDIGRRGAELLLGTRRYREERFS